MRKTLILAAAFAATLAATAQNPITPVENNPLSGDPLYVPKAFANEAYFVSVIAHYDDSIDRTVTDSLTVFNHNLSRIKTIVAPGEVAGVWGLSFDEDFLYEPHDNSMVFLTQTLFNNDNRFEYIKPIRNSEGYIIRYDVVNDDGRVVNSFGNYSSRQVWYPYILVYKIEGSAYIVTRYEDDIYGLSDYEWYRIDRQTQSISPVEALPFNVFPTVTDRSSDITVQFEDGASASELQVVDALGRTLKRIPVAPGQQEVKVSARDLAPGVNLIDDRRHGAVKIIVR